MREEKKRKRMNVQSLRIALSVRLEFELGFDRCLLKW